MSIYEQFNISPNSTDAVKAASIKNQPHLLCMVILNKKFCNDSMIFLCKCRMQGKEKNASLT